MQSSRGNTPARWHMVCLFLTLVAVLLHAVGLLLTWVLILLPARCTFAAGCLHTLAVSGWC
jgi:hypothetical protein